MAGHRSRQSPRRAARLDAPGGHRPARPKRAADGNPDRNRATNPVRHRATNPVRDRLTKWDTDGPGESHNVDVAESLGRANTAVK